MTMKNNKMTSMTTKTIKTTIFVLMLVAITSVATTGLFQESMAQTKQGKDFFVYDKVQQPNADVVKYGELVKKLKDPNNDEATKNTIKAEIEKLNQNKKQSKKLSDDEKRFIDSKKDVLTKYYADKLNAANTDEKREKVIKETPVTFITTDEDSATLRVGIDENYLQHFGEIEVSKTIRDIVGSDVDITFQSSEQYKPKACSQTGDCNPIQGGVKITMDTWTTCSVGFKATYQGYNGFITAGHCGETLDNVGNPSAWSWDLLGYIFEEKWYSGTTFDGAFVKSTESTSDKIYYNIDPSGVGTVSQYDTVAMEGYNSQGVTGTVTNSSTSVFCGGIWLYDQAKANYVSLNGDSGGPVYKTGSSTKLVGITSCGTSYDSTFSKATNLTNEFSGASFVFT